MSSDHCSSNKLIEKISHLLDVLHAFQFLQCSREEAAKDGAFLILLTSIRIASESSASSRILNPYFPQSLASRHSSSVHALFAGLPGHVSLLPHLAQIVSETFRALLFGRHVFILYLHCDLNFLHSF